MEVPSDAFDCLLHSLRNELATAIGNCDLFVMQATREGSDAARTAVAVREACERAAGHIEAWREANLTPFPHVVRPEFVEIVVPPIPTGPAFEATIERVLSSPRFRRGIGFLYDRRAAEPPSAEYLETVIGITRRYADRLGHCRWAVLVRDDDPTTPAMVRQAAARVGPASKPGPFTNVSEAIRWLTRAHGGRSHDPHSHHEA